MVSEGMISTFLWGKNLQLCQGWGGGGVLYPFNKILVLSKKISVKWVEGDVILIRYENK